MAFPAEKLERITSKREDGPWNPDSHYRVYLLAEYRTPDISLEIFYIVSKLGRERPPVEEPISKY